MGQRERTVVSAPALPVEPRAGGEALLWDLTGSPSCARARMCLHLKGVPYRRVTLTIGRIPALRRLHPQGRVPVLVHAGRTVADAAAIARYLDAAVPGPALLPSDPAARAYCTLVEQWADGALAPLAGACTWLNPENRAAAVGRTVPELAGAWPRWLVTRALVARVAWGYRARGITRARLDAVTEQLRECVATLAGLLEGRDFLLGRTPTLADVAAFAPLASLRACVEGAVVEADPVVARWADRMAAVPAVAAAL